MAPQAGSTLAERLRWLVDVAYGGSVNAMAKATRIPQRSLAMAVSGDVEEPRQRLLARIIDHHAQLGVTWEWLLTGEGPTPQPPAVPESFMAAARAAGAVHEWETLVLSLELPEPVQDALLALPDQMVDARQRLGPAFESLGVPAYRAVVHEYQAWFTWLTGWIATAGTAAVRRALTSEAAALADLSQKLTQQKPTPNRRPRKETSR